MTYESASEAEVLKSLWRPGAPLENTLFVILDPYGRPLTRGSRSPSWIFRDARAMADGLNEVASHYQSTGDPRYLPAVATVRLGLNVSACDKLPLAIVVSNSQQERWAMESTLAQQAWSPEFMGKLTYTAGTATDLSHVQGARLSRGYIFAYPNEFGTAGTVVAQLPPTASQADLRAAMNYAVANHHPNYIDHREHIRLGRQQGIQWTTAIPVTDQAALRAQQMGPPPGGGGPGGGWGRPGPGGGGYDPPEDD